MSRKRKEMDDDGTDSSSVPVLRKQERVDTVSVQAKTIAYLQRGMTRLFDSKTSRAEKPSCAACCVSLTGASLSTCPQCAQRVCGRCYLACDNCEQHMCSLCGHTSYDAAFERMLCTSCSPQ